MFNCISNQDTAAADKVSAAGKSPQMNCTKNPGKLYERLRSGDRAKDDFSVLPSGFPHLPIQPDTAGG
jgi:hypothetical protein